MRSIILIKLFRKSSLFVYTLLNTVGVTSKFVMPHMRLLNHPCYDSEVLGLIPEYKFTYMYTDIIVPFY